MAKTDLSLVQKLRDMTGLGMLNCKKALEEAGGDLDKAVDTLRKKGAAVASKRADKGTSEGIVYSYIHPGDQVGVLIEINCETDFVARTDEIKNFAKDLCLQITALKPSFLVPEDVDAEFLEKEKDIIKAQLKDAGKPENVIDKIITGKVDKIYSEICLLKQAFIKDDKKTVEAAVTELIARTGENIKIKRFARFEVGA